MFIQTQEVSCYAYDRLHANRSSVFSLSIVIPQLLIKKQIELNLMNLVHSNCVVRLINTSLDYQRVIFKSLLVPFTHNFDNNFFVDQGNLLFTIRTNIINPVVILISDSILLEVRAILIIHVVRNFKEITKNLLRKHFS